jgi:hypothetical protein
MRPLRAGWWLLGAAVAALLLACALAGLTLPSPAEGLRERGAALARWQARPFADYRLVVQDESCYYDVHVRNGQVSSSFRDSCLFQARSVDALFDVADRDRRVTPNCGTRGCLCETLTRVAASYHPQLGYPKLLEVAVEIRTNWLSPDVWRSLIATGATPHCDATNSRTITVLAVEPLAP